MENVKKEIALSERMQAIFQLIPKCTVLMDVGTDHGLIPIAAVLKQKASRAIAMDLREGPLERAKEHIKEYGLEDKIETRISDGLEKAWFGDMDVVVIAGMGGELIMRILKDGEEMVKCASFFILQPQSEIGEVRFFIREKGMAITAESMVEDRGKFYPIMLVAVHPTELDIRNQAIKKEEDLYGPWLLKQGNPTLMKFLKQEEKQFSAILEELNGQAASDKICARRLEIAQRLEWNRSAQHIMENNLKR